jgi:hypothetical protein
MPWLRCFAARTDLLDLLEFAFAQPGLQILEHYSEFDRETRRFTDHAAIAALPGLGTEPERGTVGENSDELRAVRSVCRPA